VSHERATWWIFSTQSAEQRDCAQQQNVDRDKHVYREKTVHQNFWRSDGTMEIKPGPVSVSPKKTIRFELQCGKTLYLKSIHRESIRNRAAQLPK
jgi:hypothetical protein